MWNQSIRCSLNGCRYSCTRRTFSPPSDMNTTCWFSCIPCDLMSSHNRRAWFVVVRLHVSETLRGRHLPLVVAPESDHAPAGDHLEPSLLVPRPNVPAINADGDRTVRQRLSFPILLRSLKQIQLSLLTEFLLGPLGDRVQVGPDS